MSGKRTVILKVDPRHPDKGAIARAAKVLRAGGLVAFPTETVYGLGANILDERAIANLRKVKKRPEGKPFTVHIAGVRAIKDMGCEITPEAEALIDKYWPGPLTIILKNKSGGKTGFRMPDNKIALSLIKEAGIPVAAPSANTSGKVPPVCASDVLKQLGGKIDFILDAGHTDIGVESTVVDMTVSPPRILREGAVNLYG